MNPSAFFIFINRRNRIRRMNREAGMDSQKLENVLNLALDAGKEERERSPSLMTGYLPEEKRWELIIRYFGDGKNLEGDGMRLEKLLGGYGILTVEEPLIPRVAALPEVEYVEAPKELFYDVVFGEGRAASCLSAVQPPTGRGLTGRGTVVGVIDSGIDVFHPDFRNEDGSSRILEVWDQSLGRVFTKEELDQALALGEKEGAGLVPSMDISGHGTAVAGIAAGNGRASGGRLRGVAYESGILAVKLGSFPWTTGLMRALDYAVRRARTWGRPLAVNLSVGSTYGSHDGTSLLETYLDTVSRYGRTSIIVGTGNEGAGNGHAAGWAEAGKTEEKELAVGEYETGFSLQLWKSYTDSMKVGLIAPSGETVGWIGNEMGTQRFRYGDTSVLAYHGFPSPYSQAQEIYFDFIPEKAYVDTGIWKVVLRGEKVVTGRYDLWLPASSSINGQTRFLKPDPETTLTIPSTAALAVSAGAYDSTYQAYADFSGRGYTRLTRQIKPDLAAPGVEIGAPRAGGGYGSVTGTSFAAPFVTGAAALLMEWGIVKGNDPYLYGEKVKAYLRRGARQLPGEEFWPNERMGYGALCVRDSLPF